MPRGEDAVAGSRVLLIADYLDTILRCHADLETSLSGTDLDISGTGMHPEHLPTLKGKLSHMLLFIYLLHRLLLLHLLLSYIGVVL